LTKRVLVTGASRGIGRAIAQKFENAGCIVSAPSRKELDLSDSASLESFIEKNEAASFDILINNAGINKIAELDAITMEAFDEMLQVNLKAPIRLGQAFAESMKKKKFGRIVNIGSIWAMISKPGRLTYSASKAGLIGATRTLALELAPYNILVNTVCPGFVDTDLTRQNLGERGIEEVKKLIPAGRLASVDEIAEVVYFLGSESNTYITGQYIVVDGGYTIQ